MQLRCGACTGEQAPHGLQSKTRGFITGFFYTFTYTYSGTRPRRPDPLAAKLRRRLVVLCRVELRHHVAHDGQHHRHPCIRTGTHSGSGACPALEPLAAKLRKRLVHLECHVVLRCA